MPALFETRQIGMHVRTEIAHFYDHHSNFIVQIFQLTREEIEKIISISIDYLDYLDEEFDLEQDYVDEDNGDEGDYGILEWHDAMN